MDEVENSPLILQFLPITVLGLTLAIVVGVIAKRKGRNPILSGLVAVIPFVGFFYSVWLLSLTDIEIVRRLRELEEKIGSL